MKSNRTFGVFAGAAARFIGATMLALAVGAVLGTALSGAIAALVPHPTGVFAAATGADTVQKVLDFLNQPMVKTALLLVGGLVLKQWPQVVNKTIPLTVQILSALIQTLHVAFPEAAPVQPAAYIAAALSPATGGLVSWLVGSLVPAFLAVGMQSSVKNTAEWSKVGWTVWDAAGLSGKKKS